MPKIICKICEDKKEKNLRDSLSKQHAKIFYIRDFRKIAPMKMLKLFLELIPCNNSYQKRLNQGTHINTFREHEKMIIVAVRSIPNPATIKKPIDETHIISFVDCNTTGCP